MDLHGISIRFFDGEKVAVINLNVGRVATYNFWRNWKASAKYLSN